MSKISVIKRNWRNPKIKTEHEEKSKRSKIFLRIVGTGKETNGTVTNIYITPRKYREEKDFH